VGFKELYEKKKRVFERKNTNRVNIRTELEEENILLVKDLSYHEIRFFLREKYKATYQTNLEGKKEYYLIRTPLNESIQHCFLVQIIKKYLEQYFEEVKEYRTRGPDIVFKYKNRFIALEIETGKVLEKNKKRFLRKIESLKKNYEDDWFIIVTNRDLVKKYKQFGKILTRKNFLKRLGSYVEIGPEKLHPQKRVKSQRNNWRYRRWRDW